jgi:hypothetical protein
MFALTKREQRVLIVVMFILVAAALASRYREKWRVPEPRSGSPPSSITPPFSATEREDRENGVPP